MKRIYTLCAIVALLITTLGCSLTRFIPDLDTAFPDPDGAQPLPATTAMPLGLTREYPFEVYTRATADYWDFEVLESIRGSEAWQRLHTENQFNDAPPEGMEYLLLHISVTCTYDDLARHEIGKGDFYVTGDRYVRYRAAYTVTPDPGMQAKLRRRQETTGWISFLVAQDERNLMLIFDERGNYIEDVRTRYLALTEGASLTVPEQNYEIVPAKTGTSSSEAAPFGETVSTLDFEVRFEDVVRGSQAWRLLYAANTYNDPSEDGMEYVLLKVRVRNTSIIDEAISVNNYGFSTYSGEGETRSAPAIVEPSPQLDGYLYPGGEITGWVTLLVWEGQTEPIAVFTPNWQAVSDELRYLYME